MHLDDLPPAMRSQAERKLYGYRTTPAYRNAKAAENRAAAGVPGMGGTKAERQFGAIILRNEGQYCGRSRKAFGLRVTDAGNKYTPDWIYTGPTDREVACEVKLMCYATQKDGRLIREASRLRWEVAGDRHPDRDFAWCELTPNSKWLIEVRRGGTQKRFKGECLTRGQFDALLMQLEDEDDG